ncbi:unnamed protein product [Caenorhabditis brenneri]
MTDFELKNLTNEPSSDNLSLKNWTLPEQKVTEKVEEKKEEKKVEEKKKEVKVLDGIQSLVPQYVRDMCKNHLISSELRVSYDAPTNQSTYIYSITWEDQEDGPQEQISTVVTKKVEQEPELKAVKTVSSQKIAAVVPVTAKCDGPCKREFPSNLLSTIGRCGHYLCSACYGIVKETDGTVGCSSRTCFWKGASREESKKNYEKDVCQKQREKALDMNSRGIDVKPASAASSIQELSSNSTTSMPVISETSHCNWRGNNRKEAKKYFEKEVCQKQRIRAREMKSREIDVKSASSASSSSKTASLKSGPTTPTTSTSEETDCSFQVPSTPSVDSSMCSSTSSQESSKSSKFKLVYPSEEELISVKLYILEPTSSKSKKSAQYLTHVTEYEVLSNIKVDKLITALILQKYESLPRKNTGVLYHVELQPNWSRRARQVPASAYTSAALYEFSQIADHIIFLVDFGGFVTDGSVVNVK